MPDIEKIEIKQDTLSDYWVVSINGGEPMMKAKTKYKLLKNLLGYVKGQET